MTEHTKEYMRGMGFDTTLAFDDQFIPCEICDQKCVDVHHIDARGMGGTTEEPHVRDLMGLCRSHHEMYGDKKQFKELLRTVHRLRMYSRAIFLRSIRSLPYER